MKFFIDFEATRFSNRIISIGCVADNGATFRTLVKPVNKAKVDNFITELTGITKEMLEEAPTADEAFNQLFDFIELNNDDKMPEYYCYGNTDVTFIKSTVKFMTDARACICAQAIEGHLIDYSLVVKRFFMSQQDFALCKVYMLIQGETDLVQNHDALEDAMMLRVVVSNLHSKCNPRDKETILSIPSQKAPKKEGPKAPAIFIEWDNYDRWDAPTDADETNWAIKYTDYNNRNKVKYFNDLETCALWLMKYTVRGVSPKKQSDIDKIIKIIKKDMGTKKCHYSGLWEYNPEGALMDIIKKGKK